MNMTRCFEFFILILLSSCAGSPAWQSLQISSTRSEASKNNKKMLSLKIGQSKSEVLSIMGNPAKTESYDLGGGEVIEFYFYRTQGWSTHQTYDVDFQFTPVAFHNDKLVGWGRNYYDKVTRQQLELKVGEIEFKGIPDFNEEDVKKAF